MGEVAASSRRPCWGRKTWSASGVGSAYRKLGDECYGELGVWNLFRGGGAYVKQP